MTAYWLSILSTLLGAAIGMAATFTSDRMRWSREKADRESRDRNVLYADYLAAIAATRNRLRMAGRSPDEPLAERVHIARTAFAEGRIYELRYQVALAAPKSVVDASTLTVRALRRLRDAIEGGALRNQAEYVKLRNLFEDQYQSLIDIMRSDVGPHQQQGHE